MIQNFWRGLLPENVFAHKNQEKQINVIADQLISNHSFKKYPSIMDDRTSNSTSMIVHTSLVSLVELLSFIKFCTIIISEFRENK